jgi:hypothetical protein
MRSTIALIFVLICVAAVCTVTADDLDCMCSCCKGAGCTPETQPMYPLAACTDELCATSCKTTYSDKCGGDSTVDAMCMSSASQIFNRFTTLGAFLVALIATAMLRV